jgi:hypothetical protein
MEKTCDIPAGADRSITIEIKKYLLRAFRIGISELKFKDLTNLKTIFDNIYRDFSGTRELNIRYSLDVIQCDPHTVE